MPLEPASHGCIRIPLTLSETFQDLVSNGDQVFVFDGVKEPEAYGAQLPTFNWRDPDYSTADPHGVRRTGRDDVPADRSPARSVTWG